MKTKKPDHFVLVQPLRWIVFVRLAFGYKWFLFIFAAIFYNIPSLRCQETARIRLRRNCSAPEQRIYWSTGCLNIGVKSICFSLWLYPLIQKSTLHPNRSSLERWAGEKNKSRNGASGPTLRGKKKGRSLILSVVGYIECFSGGKKNEIQRGQSADVIRRVFQSILDTGKRRKKMLPNRTGWMFDIPNNDR